MSKSKERTEAWQKQLDKAWEFGCAHVCNEDYFRVVRSTLLKKHQSMLNMRDKKELYSNCASFFQGSMTGKSLFSFNFAKKYPNQARYINLGSHGPPVDELGVDVLLKHYREDEDAFVAYYKFLLRRIEEKKNMDQEDLQHRLDRTTDVELCDILEPGDVCFVFIDESSKMRSLKVGTEPAFSVLRRVFRLFEGVLFLLVDTSSILSEVSPAGVLEASEREIESSTPYYDTSNPVRLLDPYVFTPTIMMPLPQGSYYYELGRVAWRALRRNGAQFGTLVKSARTKLFPSKSPASWLSVSWSKSEAASIAALRYSLKISQVWRTNDVLVGYRLGTALETQDERFSISVGYPIEPLLTFAAMHWCHSGVNFKRFLKVMVDELMHSLVSVGGSGELAAQIAILYACDRLIVPKLKKHLTNCPTPTPSPVLSSSSASPSLSSPSSSSSSSLSSSSSSRQPEEEVHEKEKQKEKEEEEEEEEEEEQEEEKEEEEEEEEEDDTPLTYDQFGEIPEGDDLDCTLAELLNEMIAKPEEEKAHTQKKTAPAQKKKARAKNEKKLTLPEWMDEAKVRLYRFIPIRPGHPVQASLSTYYKLGLGLSMPQGQDHCDLLVVFLYEGKYGVLLIEVKNRAYDEDYNKGVKSKGEKQAQLLRHASKFPHFPSQLKSQADVKAEEETGQEVPEAAVEKRVSTRQADKRKMTAGDTTEKEVAVKKTKTEKGSVKHTQTKEQEAGLTEEGKIESQSIVGLYINMDASDQDKKTMQAVALGKTVFVDNTSQNPFGFRCYAILGRQSLRFSKDILDIIQTLLGRDTTARTPVEKRSANLGHAL